MRLKKGIYLNLISGCLYYIENKKNIWFLHDTCGFVKIEGAYSKEYVDELIKWLNSNEVVFVHN